MTEAQAKALVATLAAAYPRSGISQATLNVYVHDLRDLEFDVASLATETARKGSKFLPSIAEIRQFAAQIQLAAPTPMSAWEQASSRGIQRHPLVQRARKLVGDDFHWREEKARFLQRTFLAAYDEVLAEATRSITQPALVERNDQRKALEAA